MSLAASRRSAIAWRVAPLVALAFMLLAPTGMALPRDDEVEADETRALTEWLSEAGLDGLLATVLEEELRKSPTTSPAASARLAEAYLRLLRFASDEDRLADLRTRILKFVAKERHPDEVRLRLALARADYRLAQRDLEALRQGATDPALRVTAAAALERARAPLAQYITLLAQRIDEDRRLAAGADDAQRQLALEQQDTHLQQLLEAKFLRNWCDYWELWLTRRNGPGAGPKPGVREEMTLDLLRAWAEILETGMPFPEPVHTSVDLRGEEYYAQSILGMALTKALKGPMAIADGWFDLLASEGLWSGLADHASWRLHALIDCGDVAAARDLLASVSPPIAPDTAVGSAIRAVAESSATPEAISLAQLALEQAASAGNLAAARRLGRAVPILAEGDTFTASLLRGIEQYEAGRRAADASAAKLAFDRAASELTRAAALGPTIGRTVAAVEELLAWSLLGAARHCDASDAFEAAALTRTGTQSDEAMWMALRSADLGSCPSKERAQGRRSAELASLYLKTFPEGNHAEGAMAILANAADAQLDGAFVDLIVRAALRDGAEPSVREAAATLLYRRFRAARDDLRHDEALRLLSIPTPPPSAWKSGTIDLTVRQQLEAALDPAVRRLDDGRRLLALIASVYPPMVEPQSMRSELALRRLSLAIEERNLEQVLASLAAVRAINDPEWRPVAEGLFIAGMERMTTEGQLSAGDPQLVAAAVTQARRSLRDSARRLADKARADAANIALGRALIEEARVMRAGASPGDAARTAEAAKLDREAMSIAEEVLAHRLDDATAVSLKADAALACGDFDSAYDALARLVGGLPDRSDEWFIRKADLCEVLARTDPEAARKALAQHAVLIPDWGPGAGGARLRLLAQQMGIAPPVKGVPK